MLEAVAAAKKQMQAEGEKKEREMLRQMRTTNEFAMNKQRETEAEKKKNEQLVREVAFLKKQLQDRAQVSRETSPRKVNAFPIAQPSSPQKPAPFPPSQGFPLPLSSTPYTSSALPQHPSGFPSAPKPGARPAPGPGPDGPNKRMRMATDTSVAGSSPAMVRPQHSAGFAPVRNPVDFDFNRAARSSQPQNPFSPSLQNPAALARSDNVLAAAPAQLPQPSPPAVRQAAVAATPLLQPYSAAAPFPPGSARARLAAYGYPIQQGQRVIPCLHCHANYWESYCTGGSPCLNCIELGLAKCERPKCQFFDTPEDCNKGDACKRAHVTDNFTEEGLHAYTKDVKRKAGLRKDEGIKILPPMEGWMKMAYEEQVEQAQRAGMGMRR
jgi:hypothetical protein